MNLNHGKLLNSQDGLEELKDKKLHICSILRLNDIIPTDTSIKLIFRHFIEGKPHINTLIDDVERIFDIGSKHDGLWCITHTDAELMLNDCPIGTYFLRFSTTYRSFITITYKTRGTVLHRPVLFKNIEEYIVKNPNLFKETYIKCKSLISQPYYEV